MAVLVGLVFAALIVQRFSIAVVWKPPISI
jgi:hypothetical protein